MSLSKCAAWKRSISVSARQSTVPQVDGTTVGAMDLPRVEHQPIFETAKLVENEPVGVGSGGGGSLQRMRQVHFGSGVEIQGLMLPERR